MKIINKMNPYEIFAKLCDGDTFILAEEEGDSIINIYIKIPSVDDGAFNAVCLNDGALEYIEDYTEIVVVKATLTIE